MPNKLFLFATFIISAYQAVAYPGQMVVELCYEERPYICVSTRAKEADLEQPAALDALANHLRNQLESQDK